jgi:hypothetical protein
VRRIVAAVALALVMPCAVAAMPADAEKRSSCQRLKGKDLAPAKTVKLVRRPNSDDGTDLLGCVLPRGPVFRVASSADEFTTTYDYALRQVAGRIVVVTSSYNSQYAFSESTHVADLRSGRAYRVASQCFEIGGSPCDAEPTTAPAVFVTKLGRAVAAIMSFPGGPTAPRTVTIATFDPKGKRRDLDAGVESEVPSASLGLAGTLASWTHAGQPRSADISSPG